MFIMLAFVMSLCAQEAGAQGRGRKARKAKMIEVTSCVTDASGNPIEGALVISGEGSTESLTDTSGRFTVRSWEKDVILVSADGYEDITVTLDGSRIPRTISLTKTPLLAGEKDMFDRMDGGKVSRRDNITAISSMDAGLLRRYPDLNIAQAFQGQVAGLVVRSYSGALGSGGASFFVRGQHDINSQAIVVIDGMERSLNDISPEEIGSVEVLKDAPAKVLYGPRAANGVILITTRRGEAHKRIVNMTAEYGVSPSTRVPEFLGAYEYAGLFNEARANDGLAPYYTEAQLTGYRNSSGENDFLSPDVDWYKRFTRASQSFRKASAEFIGGNSTMKYALIATYAGASGLEKVGKRSSTDRMNVRGNLDMRINDFITAKADVAARMDLKSTGQVGQSELFSRISSMRPNEYPLTISASDLGLAENSGGTPYFGGSNVWKQNLLDDMQYGGNASERYVVSQTNLGIEFDLGRFVEGLSAEGYITFDNYSFISQAMTKFHATYAVNQFQDASGQPMYETYIVRKLNESDNIVIGEDLTKRTIGARGNVSYVRSSGLNDFSATAAVRYYFDKGYGTAQDCITTSGTLRLGYSRNKRFFADAVLGVMGSNQLARKHRYVFTPTLALGYIVSTEPFVKVKASAGHIGYDPNADYLLYNTTWIYPGNYAVGETGSGLAYKTVLSTFGNLNLGWTTSDEANLGVETSLFDNRLQAEAAAFVELREGGVTTLGGSMSSVVGKYSRNMNWRRVLNTGAELALNWSDRLSGSQFAYKVGLNLTVSKNRVLRLDEVDGIEDYRSSVGHPSSAVIGLESEGLFGRDVQLAGACRQTFGRYIDGDVAYKDQNGDGIIDKRDETFLGQTFPTAAWGLNAELKYKGFCLYVSGTAETGASVMLNNAYWWNDGTASYSSVARDRYHAQNNPSGTYPRLTTTTGGNSYRPSGFWLRSADFLRLKNVELSYTFDRIRTDSWFKSCKLFIQGTNLLVLSAIKDLDPEMPYAGVTNYPVYSTVAGGVTISL